MALMFIISSSSHNLCAATLWCELCTDNNMGLTISNMFGSEEAAKTGSSSEPSPVLSFHSSDTWKLHYDAAKDSPKLMVIDFAASWCGPCKAMEPVVRAMAGKFDDVEFVRIDVDELKDVAEEFEVTAMPTFVLVKKGKEVDRLVGANKGELEKKILEHRAVQAAD